MPLPKLKNGKCIIYHDVSTHQPISEYICYTLCTSLDIANTQYTGQPFHLSLFFYNLFVGTESQLVKKSSVSGATPRRPAPPRPSPASTTETKKQNSGNKKPHTKK